MLWNASAIHKYAVEATDGPIGTVSDFLFDDAHWKVRWLVIDTGEWSEAGKVIVPTQVVGHPDPATRTLSVKLTRDQVEKSPAVGDDQPISRETEASAYKHYGASPYWGADYLGGYHAQWASTPFPVSGDQERAIEAADARRDKYNPSLRSFALVDGYHIEGRDGNIGHVEDFIVDDRNWSIAFLVVDTRNWWAGKRVLILPRSVLEIDWQERMVTLNADRQKVKDSPAYDPAATLDKAFVQQFHRHYGLPAEDEGPLA